MVSTFRTHNFTTRYPIIIRLYCHSTHVSKLVPFHTWVRSLPTATWVTNAASCSTIFLDVHSLVPVKPGHVAFWSRRYFRCNLLPHYVWGLYLCYCVQYSIAGNFRGRNFCELVKKYNFRRENFCKLLAFACPRMPRPPPQISWRKLSWIATKLRNSRNFSALKVSRYNYGII